MDKARYWSRLNTWYLSAIQSCRSTNSKRSGSWLRRLIACSQYIRTRTSSQYTLRTSVRALCTISQPQRQRLPWWGPRSSATWIRLASTSERAAEACLAASSWSATCLDSRNHARKTAQTNKNLLINENKTTMDRMATIMLISQTKWKIVTWYNWNFAAKFTNTENKMDCYSKACRSNRATARRVRRIDSGWCPSTPKHPSSWATPRANRYRVAIRQIRRDE